MAPPGASSKKRLERLEVDLWSFGDADIEDLKPATPQLKKKY